MRVTLLVIGGGLSGLAAAIRAARFTPDVLLLEKHSRIGGLNSYYYRNKTLFETGLHAITNYAPPDNKHAPLNKLLRQLKIKRSSLSIVQQRYSEIIFENCESLKFSNNIELLLEEVKVKFRESYNHFVRLLKFVEEFDPFRPKPFQSARTTLMEILAGNSLLTEMLLCPLMYYGSARTDDIDLDQFVIMFRALFIEGMFRPSNTIKDFLKMLEKHYTKLGGSIQTNSPVSKIVLKKDSAVEAILEDGSKIEFDFAISTIGLTETLELFEPSGNYGNQAGDEKQRLGFVESIFTADQNSSLGVHKDSTIVFYNNGPKFNYQLPQNLVDYRSGVICFPHNFENLSIADKLQVRTTHLANYENWRKIAESADNYTQQKKQMAEKSLQRISQILGSTLNFSRCEDSFTPLTIERYTSKKMGAIYGSPVKIKDGRIGPSNVFLAGTDQGFLGIVGSMLSGVSIVNQHILSKI